MTQRRKGAFRCVQCGNTVIQPIDERHPKHEIRSPCCGVALVTPIQYEDRVRANAIRAQLQEGNRVARIAAQKRSAKR
jgi:ribosomal protein S27E